MEVETETEIETETETQTQTQTQTQTRTLTRKSRHDIFPRSERSKFQHITTRGPMYNNSPRRPRPRTARVARGDKNRAGRSRRVGEERPRRRLARGFGKAPPTKGDEMEREITQSKNCGKGRTNSVEQNQLSRKGRGFEGSLSDLSAITT